MKINNFPFAQRVTEFLTSPQHGPLAETSPAKQGKHEITLPLFRQAGSFFRQVGSLLRQHQPLILYYTRITQISIM